MAGADELAATVGSEPLTFEFLTSRIESALGDVDKQRRFAETILNSMVSAILTTDAGGTVTFANLGALRTLGSTAEQVLDFLPCDILIARAPT